MWGFCRRSLRFIAVGVNQRLNDKPIKGFSHIIVLILAKALSYFHSNPLAKANGNEMFYAILPIKCCRLKPLNSFFNSFKPPSQAKFSDFFIGFSSTGLSS